MVGLKFADITQVEKDKAGDRKVHIVPKKTVERDIFVSPQTYDAVVEYQRKLNALDHQVMFKAGKGSNQANMWVKKLKRFYEKHAIKVKSHDFRTTLVTDLYNSEKDIVKV